MKIRTSIVCLPIRTVDKTLAFYENALGLSDAHVEDGMITLELPNLSLFLMEKEMFEIYTKKVERAAQFPGGNTSVIISCAVETKEDIDDALKRVPEYGGTVPKAAAMDETSGGYTGYLFDPDGHLWELVCPRQVN